MVSGLKISNFKITTMVLGWGWGGGGQGEIIYSSISRKKAALLSILARYQLSGNVVM